MNDKEKIYDWEEVMGNNMIFPTPIMAYKQAILTRKTRLRGESYHTPTRYLKVKHDTEFVVWRIANVLKEFIAADEPKLREIFELVLKDIRENSN